MSPVTIDEALQTAVSHHQAGRLAAAESLYRQILALNPRHADALHLLGVLAGQSGDLDMGISHIRTAIELAPDHPDYFSNLGTFLYRQGKLEEAIGCYRQLLLLRPDDAEAHFQLGNIWKDKDGLNEAIECYRRAVDLRSDYAEANNNLGTTLWRLLRLDEAIACFHQALAVRPDFAEAHANLGNAYRDKGNVEGALACYQRAVSLRPDFHEVHNSLGNLWRQKGETDKAMECYQRAVAIQPQFIEGRYNIANVLLEKGHLDSAIAIYEKVLSERPDYAEAYMGNGLAHFEKGQLDIAIRCYQMALTLKPDYLEAHLNLGNAWKESGRLDDAISAYRQALAIDPHAIVAHNNLLYTLPFHPDSTRQSLYIESSRWHERHALPLQHLIRPHLNDRDPARRLNIGYVSADFRDHPVGRFMLPLLAAHNGDQFEIFCYANGEVSDATATKLQAQADHWRSIGRLTDDQLAETIRGDAIDILIDLSMHMHGNRLLTFARKPAPVQVTYLAYAGGTGVAAIDYRLSDRHLDPEDALDAFYLEKSVRLKTSYWCYQPVETMPPVNALSSDTAGVITFGCLNNFCKVTESVVATWADLLRMVPDSRLLLHTQNGEHRQRLTKFFSDRGIAPSRVEMIGRVTTAAYFGLYHRLDIALDTFPYAGGTTTCDALWMGVPVVTLAGQTAVGRSGVSILHNLGLPELIASDSSHYVQLAAGLAEDKARLRELRCSMSERMRHSALMNAPQFAREVEDAYRTMWCQWCSRIPES